MGASPNIFCFEIKRTYVFFKSNCDSFFPSRNSYSFNFCSRFGILGLYVGTLLLIIFIHPLFLSIGKGI